MSFFAEIITREKFIIERGSHIMDAIMIVLDGCFSFSAYGKGYHAEKNDVCIFPKDILFERIVREKVSCIYIQFDTFPFPLNVGILRTTDQERTQNTIAHLFQAVKNKNSTLSLHFVMDILYLHTPPSDTEISEDPTLANCIKYISENYREYISLDLLAERFSLSKQSIIQKFKKHTQKTPMEYLLFVRIDSAKLMLKSTSLTVGEIAEKCGFENIYYFSNRFKKATGISPSEYKRQVTDEIKRF